MTNGWDQARELSKKVAESNGIFVQLKDDGDKVAGVFCGDPYAREAVWIDGEGYEDFDPQRHAGKRPGLRVAINFFDLADGRMKVFEGGTQWFKGILAVRAKFPFDQWSIEIERQGAARDPKTTYSCLPHAQIDAALKARIAACTLHDLTTVVRGDRDDAENGGGARVPRPEAGSGSQPRGQATAPAGAATIDGESALRIVERLKQLPRAAVDEYLRELGVSRIREIPSAKRDHAEQFLSQLERAYRSREDEPADPFA